MTDEKGNFVLPFFNDMNEDGTPFHRIKGDAPVMAQREPKDYPEGCECDTCKFAKICNISCHCVVNVEFDEEDEK